MTTPIRPETKLREYDHFVIQQKQEIRFRSCFYLLRALILQAAAAKWTCCARAAPLKVLLSPTQHHSQDQNQKFNKINSNQSCGGSCNRRSDSSSRCTRCQCPRAAAGLRGLCEERPGTAGSSRFRKVPAAPQVAPTEPLSPVTGASGEQRQEEGKHHQEQGEAEELGAKEGG